MGKYDPLHVYLEGLPAGTREKTLSFAQIEAIIGASLPASAHRYREWWANERSPGGHVQARAWLEAGWAVDTVNLEKERVHLVRDDGGARP